MHSSSITPTHLMNPSFRIDDSTVKRRIHSVANFIFMTRWLQLPLYPGLILAQCIYVFHFANHRMANSNALNQSSH
ncbi:hypothetical protein HEAR0920 [Herminiimonas arsenicoxydans]|uniref:Uncharacterized protein n=1 Tax=Herminiimonas arsenicoxydans TaxID=204773 RepID=A4G3L7_HERAR|nr:hypothetical protein HEAR0920 [Herminiimonas arsenicoxydans]